jgi:hypothetical protein
MFSGVHGDIAAEISPLRKSFHKFLIRTMELAEKGNIWDVRC